jgi:hypothetical protein
MKTLYSIVLLLSFSGCAHSPYSKVTFAADAVKLEPDEAISQITLHISKAKFVKSKALPVDWSVGSKNSQDETQITLTCEHDYFSIRDIKEVSGCVFIESDPSPYLRGSEIYTTKGPIGPGRIIKLSSGDVAFIK